MAYYAYSVLTRWFSSVYCLAGSETALSKQLKHQVMMVSFGINSIPAKFNRLNHCIGPVENIDLMCVVYSLCICSLTFPYLRQAPLWASAMEWSKAIPPSHPPTPLSIAQLPFLTPAPQYYRNLLRCSLSSSCWSRSWLGIRLLLAVLLEAGCVEVDVPQASMEGPRGSLSKPPPKLLQMDWLEDEDIVLPSVSKILHSTTYGGKGCSLAVLWMEVAFSWRKNT